MNAVVYARFSSHRQGEQSIEGQLAEARRFADAHGLTIIHEYCDRAMTGRNDNREQFQLMLADAAKHIFDALIVWKTDRIGRNKEEIALNKYHLKKNGIKIYYVAESIPDTPEGIFLESVIEGMLWDTCNRAVNLVINNLKGIFFWDDDWSHMAFSVIGAWGETGRTVVRISRFLQP